MSHARQACEMHKLLNFDLEILQVRWYFEMRRCVPEDNIQIILNEYFISFWTALSWPRKGCSGRLLETQ